MKKTIFIILMIFLFPANEVFADDTALSSEYQSIIDEQYDAAGVDDLMDNLPGNVEEQLTDNGIDSASSESILGIGISDFFSNLWTSVLDIINKPIQLLVVCFGIMLLCALLQALQSTVESTISQVFTSVCTLAICAVLVEPITNCITYAAQTIQEASNFMLCFIPVFTGIVSASGMTISGLGYNTALFAAIQLISSITAKILVPFLGVFLALSIVTSISGELHIEKLTSSVKKTIIWTLTFLVTIFTGIFSAQTMVATSADTVATKTAKFAVSSFVPVVGSALGDALTSVQGCLSLVKSSVGAFGIIVCLLTFLPPMITVIFYMLAVKLVSAMGHVLQIEGVDGIFQAIYDTLSILLAFLICFSILAIVCTAMMISMGTG